MLELAFDRGEVRIDVGVIVFEVVEHQRARPVVHELGALVEERRVVLVGLDDEERRLTEPRAVIEIFWFESLLSDPTSKTKISPLPPVPVSPGPFPVLMT